jgi:hypothetical protein
MSRIAVLSKVVGLYAGCALAAGCMALPNLETAVFQDPLLTSRGMLPLKAAMMTLEDRRPAPEREGLGDIENFAERVTLVMLTDLSETRLFKTIEHARNLRDADVILRGEIRSFVWKPRHKLAPYIPGLGILAAFGVPVADSEMAVEIALEVVNPKTAQPIASYTRAARDTQAHFVYRFQDSRAGHDQEPNSAFRRVALDLQTAILDDGQRIVAALK